MQDDLFSSYRPRLLEFHRSALAGGFYPRSFRIALLVGTLLNLINQPEVFVSTAPLDLTKALLTYVVPFLVATYGAVTATAIPRG
jgi:hypothetical protein